LIMGDFNFPTINWDDYIMVTTLYHLLSFLFNTLLVTLTYHCWISYFTSDPNVFPICHLWKAVIMSVFSGILNVMTSQHPPKKMLSGIIIGKELWLCEWLHMSSNRMHDNWKVPWVTIPTQETQKTFTTLVI